MKPETPHHNVEIDERFSSGPYRGFYEQMGIRSRQRLSLRFYSGKVTGDGSDPCDPFSLSGDYDVNSGRVQWVKRYLSHEVEYLGRVMRGEGIVGTWQIRGRTGRAHDSGRFRVWPDEVKMQESRLLREKAPVTASETQWLETAVSR